MEGKLFQVSKHKSLKGGNCFSCWLVHFKISKQRRGDQNLIIYAEKQMARMGVWNVISIKTNGMEAAISKHVNNTYAIG